MDAVTALSDSTIAHLALLVALSALTLAGALLRRVTGVERSIRPPRRRDLDDTPPRRRLDEDHVPPRRRRKTGD